MTHQPDNHDLGRLYDESVSHEREAWQALHTNMPGSAGRARAWDEWSQAIVRTNRAWRRYSTSRITHAHA